MALTKRTVEDDIFNFLKYATFGIVKDELTTASRFAYRDMNRTLRFHGLADDKRLLLREEVLHLLKSRIPDLLNGNIENQEQFDSWHRLLSQDIKEIYMKEGILFTYGQAQKWINMTIKYLYILEYNPFEVVFPYLHVPLDNYVFDIAESLLDISRPELAWSKIDSYEDYMAYENALRNAITDRPALRWEFENWLRQIEKNTSH